MNEELRIAFDELHVALEELLVQVVALDKLSDRIIAQTNMITTYFLILMFGLGVIYLWSRSQSSEQNPFE